MRETYNIQVEATYRDGVMEDEPNACAAVKGTQIMIENLFYNMTARRKTLQNSAARADVHSVAIPSRLDTIRSVYDVSVARNLVKIDVSDNDPSNSVFEVDGFISNANYIAKKITMVLFINDRLVDCGAFKRAIERGIDDCAVSFVK